jgi:putative ABC transport system permease protein
MNPQASPTTTRSGLRWTALVEEALLALAANRLRSALTMLGVVIGVASVILMLAIGEGSQQRVAASIASLGSHQLMIMSGSANVGGMRGSAGTLPTLSLADAQAIGELTSIRAVAPVSQTQAQVVYGARNKSTVVTGTTPAYFAVNNWPLRAGVAFGEPELRASANVAVMGSTVARELFGPSNPVGETIRIQRQLFEVIGVLATKGQGFGGQDQDDIIVMPVTTLQRKLSGTVIAGNVGMIQVERASVDDNGLAAEEITRLLRQRHRIATGQEDDFNVRDMSALTSTLKLTSTILSALLGSIAFISLAVGGIGIMNIMLVSVTERTREIGLRMALGAHRYSVLAQFLIESILLSLAGAGLGVLLGFAAGWLIGLSGALTPVYSSWSVGLAFLVAVAVGVSFGFWPARRAASLDPVEALRHG